MARRLFIDEIERAALAYGVAPVERSPQIRRTVLDENLVARVEIARVRVRVFDDEIDRSIVAGDGEDFGVLLGRYDNGLFGDDLHARILVILKERLRIGVVDRRLEHDARCACRERIASQTEDVNLLLGGRIRGDGDGGDFIVGKSRNLGLRFGETDIFADVLRRDAVDGRGDFHDHILTVGFREINAHHRAVNHIVSVGVRDGTVRLYGNRRRQRLETLDGHLDIVCNAGARRFGVVVVLPGAHDELAGLAGAARDAFNLKICGGDLSAGENDLADINRLLVGSGRVHVELDRLVGLDAHYALVRRPDVKLDLLFRRSLGCEFRRKSAACNRRSGMNGAPDAARSFNFPGFIKPDRLHIEIALCERIILDGIAAVGRLHSAPGGSVAFAHRRSGPEPEIAAVAVIAVGDLPIGEISDKVRRFVRTGVINRAVGGGTVLGREHDRKRDISRTGRILKDKIGKQSRIVVFADALFP